MKEYLCLWLRSDQSLDLDHGQPPHVSSCCSLANRIELVEERWHKRAWASNLGPPSRQLSRHAKHGRSSHGSDQPAPRIRRHHGTQRRAQGTPRPRDHAQILVPVVDAEGVRAVAQDVGDARNEDDAAVRAGEGADELGPLLEGEGGGGVDALLGDGGAVQGLDLAFVAFDDGELARGEEGFDGCSADGGGSGSVCALVSASILISSSPVDLPDWIIDYWSVCCIVGLDGLDVAAEALGGHCAHVDDEGASQLGQIGGFLGVVGHDGTCAHRQGNVGRKVLYHLYEAVGWYSHLSL